MNKLPALITRFLASKLGFRLAIGFFVFEALWFVFSAVYPMAFDEDFHFGLIKLYAQHWSPFLTSQPLGADQYGAITRDPSFLYHYLMSFPYRLVVFFTSSQTTQVITLRLINVAMASASLVLYARVMRLAKASPALTNVALVVFALVPVAPQLAAHINYDNLLMLLLPILCLSMYALLQKLAKRQIAVEALFAVVLVSIVMSLVKYAALPFVAAAVLFFVAAFGYYFRGHVSSILPAVRTGFMQARRPVLVALAGLILVSLIGFGQRYGVNLVRYHTPVPRCDAVLTEAHCSAYGPWIRDHIYEQTRDPAFEPHFTTYMVKWVRGMWHRLFFAINGPMSNYTNYLEMPLPSKAAIPVAAIGLLLAAVWYKKLFKDNPYLLFLASMTLLYVGILIAEEFEGFSRTGIPVAINGRYLLPVLFFMAVVLGKAISLTLRRAPYQVKPLMTIIVLVLFLNGGGIGTFILRSDDSWYWPNQAVRHVNHAAQQILSPVTVEGQKILIGPSPY